ncbi:Hyccin [Armadillidium nasatum]|uniref:Hyccin n=1 Tax=Armadillidium nasatum TaxID=96803 RepID=A0A5N5TFY6_9CRUS|nr:Hyccin [Armadillidium nasatum]
MSVFEFEGHFKTSLAYFTNLKIFIMNMCQNYILSHLIFGNTKTKCVLRLGIRNKKIKDVKKLHEVSKQSPMNHECREPLVFKICAMEKAVSTIEEWLQNCDINCENDHITTCIENDQDRLIHSIFSLFDEKSRYPELFENTMKQLFKLARSKEEKIRDFVLLFVPSLIYIYLSAVSMGEKKSVSNIELTLVSLYNTEVLSEKGIAEVASFRLPTLARQSVYHERLEAGDAETVRWGPPKHMTTVTAATRYHLATALLVAFNARLSKFPKIVLVYLCKATSKLVCQGFSRPGHHHRSSYGSDGNFGVYPRPVPRIPVTSDLLAELVHGVYFAITEGPMGISIALTPSTSAAPLSKTYITNASFRTKKLPDDIPVQRIDGTTEGTKGLKIISEDQDGEEKDMGKSIRTPQGSSREKEKDKTRLSANLPLTNLVKKRDKDRNRNGERRRFR